MPLDFPASPTVGDKYPTPAVANTPQYTWDGAKWTISGPSTVATFVAKGGDTMSGPLVLPADPTTLLQAATKNYAETSIRQLVSVSGTAYTLILTDVGKLILFTNAAATTLTLPPDSSVAFPIGTQIDIMQAGTGQVSVAAGGAGAVSLWSSDGAKKLVKQWASATLIKTAANNWVMTGALTV